MKSKKLALLLFVFSVICLTNINLRAENTDVDSVYNVLKGTWYKIFAYSGMTGNRDSIFNSDSTVIMRIANTDSIIWKEYQNSNLKNVNNYRISYSNSFIYHSNRWMLNNGSKRIIVDSEPFGFSCFLDAIDAGGEGYSRSKISTGIFETNHIKRNLVAYPNPTHNLFSIAGIAQIRSIEIHDLSGKLLQVVTNVLSGQSIDISKLYAGVYIISVNTDSDVQKVRIIKN